jgi:hypothetical protein
VTDQTRAAERTEFIEANLRDSLDEAIDAAVNGLLALGWDGADIDRWLAASLKNWRPGRRPWA